MGVLNGTIGNAIGAQLQLTVASSLKRALRPSANVAELAVIVAPLHASSLTEFGPRFMALFAAEHSELVATYIQ